MSSEITKKPFISFDTDEVERAARIKDIKRRLYNNPERFQASCRKLGVMAVEYMPEVRAQEDETTTQNLGIFLANNDLRYTTFDPESDEAIFDDSGVSALTKVVIQSRGERADQVRSSLSALKLYLFSERTIQYREQQVAEQSAANGAA